MSCLQARAQLTREHVAAFVPHRCVVPEPQLRTRARGSRAAAARAHMLATSVVALHVPPRGRQAGQRSESAVHLPGFALRVHMPAAARCRPCSDRHAFNGAWCRLIDCASLLVRTAPGKQFDMPEAILTISSVASPRYIRSRSSPALFSFVPERYISDRDAESSDAVGPHSSAPQRFS